MTEYFKSFIIIIIIMIIINKNAFNCNFFSRKFNGNHTSDQSSVGLNSVL